MKKDDIDLDWGDDFFSDDIAFNSDFDSDFSGKKSFGAGLASGFMSGLFDETLGDSIKVENTLKSIFPSTYTTFFEKVTYYNKLKDNLITEFKEENHQNITILQDIAAGLSNKIRNENNIIKKKLINFSENDFSSWEKKHFGGGEETPVFEDDTHANFSEDVDRLINAEQENNRAQMSMSAEVGGRIISAVKTGNNELIGIESGMKDLLDYQRNVQFRLDRSKIEIAAKNYILDARFYKFSEKAHHRIIDELKKIAINSGKSDYQKTTLSESIKSQTRDGLLNVVGRRIGGFMGTLSERLSSENRKELYGKPTEFLSNLSMALASDAPAINPGETLGRFLSSIAVEMAPGIFARGPLYDQMMEQFENLDEETKKTLRSGWGKVRDFGNIASYLTTSGGGLLDEYADNWTDLEENKFDDYEDYVEYQQRLGRKVLPKPLFMVSNFASNYAKQRINTVMGELSSSKSSGTQYTLPPRDATTITQVGQWREINNITLVDVIPGLLTRIYESQEKMRTGNDAFVAPMFSYARGEFVDRKINTKIVKNDVFPHQSFFDATTKAKDLVNELDNTNLLSESQKNALAEVILNNTDKNKGFKPFDYVGDIPGLDENLTAIVNDIFKERFGISDELSAQYNAASPFERSKITLGLVRGERGDEINRFSKLVDEIKVNYPNLAKEIEDNRNAGNEAVLREIGLIETKNGQDMVNRDLITARLREYLVNPTNPELKGDYVPGSETHAGATRLFKQGNIDNLTQAVSIDTSEIVSRLDTLIDTVNQQSAKLDLSKLDLTKLNINVDLGEIPHKLDILNQTSLEQTTVLKTISECVCRTANGWGAKSSSEKAKIVEEEEQGKRSLLEKIKAFSPRDFFNKSIETLASNSPLMLTGLAAGLAGYAFKDPRTAGLLAAGVGVGMLYGKFKSFASGTEPSDDENILDANGNVLLYASKLRNGDYYDVVSKKVITTWKAIKGAVYDVVTKTYTTLAQLTGKLFGPDNRERVLKGLSKAKDFAQALWNRVDLSGWYQKGLTFVKDRLYQQDVYVAGDSEPRLVRSGFRDKRYYCLDKNTKKPFVIHGWNEIKGPVYALDDDGALTQIISLEDIAQGLRTSSGLRLDTLKKTLGWGVDKARDALGKFGGYAKEKIGKGVDGAMNLIKADYTSIETRIDRIYYLLCKKFELTPEDIPSTESPEPKSSAFRDEGEKGFRRFFKKSPASDDPIDTSDDYPKKVRLNSFEDKEQKEQAHKRDTFYDDVHAIKEAVDGGLGAGDNKKDKKKKGFLGLIGSVLGSGLGVFKKLFTNPLGLIGDVIGGGLSAILKSPLRLIKIGSLLFSGVLGLTSPLYKLLKWGLGGIVTLLAKGGLALGGSLFDKIVPSRRNKKSSHKPSRKMGGKGKGAIAATALTAGLAFLPSFGADAAMSDLPTLPGVPDFDDGNNSPVEDINNTMPQDDADSVIDRIINNGAVTAAGASLGVAGLNGLGGLAQRYAPTATNALTASRAGGALAATRRASKLVGGIAGKAALPLALAQGALSFTDSETVGDIFNTHIINGTQRAAHTVTDFLDVAGMLGIDMGQFSGVPTRIVDDILDNPLTRWINKIPGIEATPFGVLKVLHNFETDLSTDQRRIRYAMYGIADTKSQFARVIEGVEQALLPYVSISSGRVKLNKNAPIVDIIKSLTMTKPAEAAVWFKQRFEPIYKLWLSAANIAGYPSLDAVDRDRSPSVMKIVNQVQSAVVQFTPHPYDVFNQFSKEYPVMDRALTEKKLTTLNKELRIKFKEQGIDENGDLSNKIVIKTADEVKEGKPDSDSWFDVAKAKLLSGFTKLSLIGFEEPKTVIEIDISDLHPSNGAEMDILTMVRLAAYGDVEHRPVKVDAVLKLERYCEQFFTLKNGLPTFDKKPQEILAIFKNTFQLVPSWMEEWEKWFTDRFLPVLTQWVGLVYQSKRKWPRETWKQLNVTERANIGHALADVKVEIKGKAVPVWQIKEGPFFNTTSGEDSSITKRWLDVLDAKRTEQQLKDPTANKVPVNPNKPKPRMMTDAEKYAVYHSGGTFKSSSVDSGAAGYGSSHLPTLPATTNTPSSRNYNESLLPAAGSGAYGKVDATGDTNYTPESTKKSSSGFGGPQFKISRREAKKVILNEFLKRGINDKTTLAFAIANADVESSLDGKTEDLHYRESVLLNKFKNFKEHPELARQYGKNEEHGANPRMIARIAYGRGKNAKNLGNKNEDDGEKFIGRGFTQMTGRYNYTAVGNEVGEDYVNHPEKVGADPLASAKSTYGYFKTSGTLAALQRNDPQEAARIINKGDPAGQQKKLSLFPKYLKELENGELKNVLNELNARGVEKEGGDPQAESKQLTGLDGSQKINVPVENGEKATVSAPPITAPVVSINDAQPDVQAPSTPPVPPVVKAPPVAPAAPAPQPAVPVDTVNETKKADVAPKVTSPTVPPVAQEQEKKDQSSTSKGGSKKDTPAITEVRDSTVAAKLDKLIEILYVPPAPRRVGVSGRQS